MWSSCCLDVQTVNICNCSIYLPPTRQPSLLIRVQSSRSSSSRAFFVVFLGRGTEGVLERRKEIRMCNVRMSGPGLLLALPLTLTHWALLIFPSVPSSVFSSSLLLPLALSLGSSSRWYVSVPSGHPDKCLGAPPLIFHSFFIPAFFLLGVAK